VVLSAATQTARAGLAVAALLEHHDALGREAPRPDETETATRYLSDIFLVGVGTVRAVASMTADLRLFSLPDAYYDDYRAEVRALGPEALFATARETFRVGSAVVVVAGDAATLTRPLSRLARVNVVDADAGFITRAVTAQDPSAELALPEAAGR